MPSVRIFKYIEQIDAFVVSEQYHELAKTLGLSEWNSVVWIGRLFALDNDYGEHWFDNWKERSAVTDQACEMALLPEELMIIAPGRFKNDYDGPCHSDNFRKQFWTDVLMSMELSYNTLFEQARQVNKERKETIPDEYIVDLEERIALLESNA